MPYQPMPVVPQYRPLRALAIVSIALMGVTALGAVIQCVLLWRSYGEVKRFVYGLLSDDEIQSGMESIAGTGPLLNLVSYLLIGTGIAFLIWLWRARDNVDFLYSPFAPNPTVPTHGAHRRSPGWVIGSWLCPIVQFWYPLQVVEDVARASEPADQPGVARSGRIRTLLYTWWVAWSGFWVIIVGGGSAAVIGFVIWIVRLVEVADSDVEGQYVDVYDLQDYMVRVALAVDIGFTVATVLLVVAAVTASLLMLQIGSWQLTRLAPPPAPPVQDFVPPPQPPQYAPRQQHPGPGFPTYGP